MSDGVTARPAAFVDLLHELHSDVAALEFPFEVPGAEETRELQQRVATQIASHLLPRLADDEGPAVVVLGGSTGAGKSTLFNSLVGEDASAAGVLRPTTRRAVAAHHPSVHTIPVHSLADSIPSREVPTGMVLVDTPDLDSLERENRSAATRLLEAADLWLLVTTAARYGDKIPWEQVVRARDRGLQLAVVLNRVPADALRSVRADLVHRLERLGLGNSPLFVIPELPQHEGHLPEEHITPLRDWLRAATGRHQARGIVRRTTAGAWSVLGSHVQALAEGVTAQADAASRLRSDTLEALRGPQADLVEAIASGQCALGAPTTRWETFSRAGMVLAPFSIPGSRASRTARATRDRNEALARLAGDVEAAVVTLLADAMHDAPGSIHREWAEAGALDLVEGTEPISSQEARDLALRTLAGWRLEVARIVDESPTRDPALSSLTESSGVVSLVVAAAGGVAGAEAATTHFLSAEVAASAREALLAAVRHAIGTTAEPYLRALRDVPDADVASRLAGYATELEGVHDGK